MFWTQKNPQNKSNLAEKSTIDFWIVFSCVAIKTSVDKGFPVPMSCWITLEP